MEKKCVKCKVTKDLSKFYRNKRATDGLTYRCKKCLDEARNDLARRKAMAKIKRILSDDDADKQRDLFLRKKW